jgi:glutamate synthase (NADPH/NADH) large chain
MLNLDESLAKQQRIAFEEELIKQGLVVAGWRKVPVDTSCLGPIALKSLPGFYHLFVNSDLPLEQINSKLFTARRKTELRLAADKSFYVASLSTGVLSYKGLMMPVDLPGFFSDLADPRLETAICVFHQRFSTNTMPVWPLAQP